ncbi:alpha/beta fold hydrolase [Rhizorhabdus wittichii]|uniref:Alpha/beta fold hydrolase n=1 Tax=Rhizorhabdus wittichii TaxID=160791 RepID=A0A975D553_9SPHN|nr:alpha/beta fold hydrolase [Rhizorhabdus wittichii]QTH23300.1 alpha/beta fold hydrolase [Rhizorhabdus wittichii]
MRGTGRAILAGLMQVAMTGEAVAADTAKAFTAPIEGGRLHYEMIGGGDQPPLVLVNGGPGLDHRYFHGSPVWEGLSKRRPVVFYDQRGMGRTTSTIAVDRFTVDMMVADLEALRVRLGVPKIALLGHSWGGLLSMAYATRHPDHVSRLVLVGSGAPKIAAHEYLFDKLYPEIAARQVPDDSPAAKMGCKADSLEDYGRMAYYDQRNQPRLAAEDNSAFSQEVCTAVMLDAMKLDLFPRLHALHVPTLVINGRFDANVAPTVAYAISKAIPGATLDYFEHSGHQPFEEEPDRFELVVERFLDQ